MCLPFFVCLPHFRRPGVLLVTSRLVFLSLLLTGSIAHAGLPTGWTNSDIGFPALPGAASFTNGTWSISGSGVDICSTDQFHYAWTRLKGDGALIARVTGMTNTDVISKAGILIRSDTNPGAPQVSILANPNFVLRFNWRTAQDAACGSQVAVGLPSFMWLKLLRSGNTFTAFYSPDATLWTQLGQSHDAAVSRNALAGLAVTARNETLLCTAAFSDVSIIPPVFGIYREAWTGLNSAAGNTLAALTNTALNPNWPDRPDPESSVYLPTWEADTNTGNTYYGERMRAFIVPPADGDYRFWISSRNTSELWLSTNELPASAAVIARVSTFTEPREWGKEQAQQSAFIHLLSGRRYYLESRVQHSTGVDHLAARWQLPDGTIEEPLGSATNGLNRLIPFSGTEAIPGIYHQPVDVTVAEGEPATFSLLVTNQSAVAYQWQLNGTNLGGAETKASALIIPIATVLLNTNHVFTCLVSNSTGSVTSAPARVNVIGDSTPPVLLGAAYGSSSNVVLTFSEPLESASATNIANYSFTNGLGILRATLSDDAQKVTLDTPPLEFAVFYQVGVNGVRDQSYNGNLIAPDSKATFFASVYTPDPVGNPQPPGTIAGTPNGGFDLAGGGKDIGGTYDQFQFAWQLITGDFDIKVRLQSLSQTDIYAKAGLMARQDLSSSSSFAAVLSTPTISGSSFAYRTSAGSRAVSVGNLPPNYPETWLRLKRVGDLFSGFGSYDGQSWQPLGSTTLALTNPVYFGMAVSSHTITKTALAAFRDLSDVTNAIVERVLRTTEPPGPSSRRSGLAITEIMYHPAARTDGRNLEFVEILNTQPFFEDISGYSLSGDIDYTFPPGTLLPSGACLTVAKNRGDLSAVYPLESVVGPYTNSLANGSGTVRLRNKANGILLEVTYGTTKPWPVEADGTGHSLVLARPSYGEAEPRAWAASDRKGGSPGTLDPFHSEPARSVVINEYLAHTEPPARDAIELFNRGSTEVDLSGCYLSDSPSTNKFRIPDGTRIGPRGFRAFDETQLGFRLNAGGETLFFVNATDTTVLDAVRFEGQANGVSSGRYPDGEATFAELSFVTLGAANALPLSRDIVLNEIMYHPISGSADDQYVELYNKGQAAVNVGGWRFTDGISFTFPVGTTIPADGYLVVARNTARMLTNYPNLNAANLVGDFNGSLSAAGEHLALAMPDQIPGTNQYGQVVTNTIYIVVSEVTFGTDGRWGQWSDGGGSSLELIDPRADTHLAPNWADSDETLKAAWTTIDFTGLLDNGAAYSGDQLHVLLQGAGECLLDDVAVLKPGSTNRLKNSTFTSDAANWFFQGTHRASSYEAAGGFGGGGCLHVRTSGRGDTGANRIRTAISPALLSGETATLRAKARWLRGNPEILLRLHGNWLEAAQKLNLPTSPGTPGAPNSRYVTNAGPAITDVVHSPVLPAATDPITVTARVSDPDKVDVVTLYYRNDAAGSATSTLPMKDDGTDGDTTAGDGVYTATIPPQTARSIVAFYVRASDASTAHVSTTFPNDAPARECLLGIGESVVAGSFGNYRTWVTKANVAYWSSREKNSNDPIDASFAYGDFRVVYNMRTLYSGSPFHTSGYNSPVGSACDYVLNFPSDDGMLGATDFVIATLGNLNNDPTDQAEQTAFWILDELGVPSMHRRYTSMFVNGVKRGSIMEDSQQPSSDVIDEFFPNDSKGQLHKIEDWFEFDNTGSSFNNIDATLENFTTTGGVKKTARYRWSWRPRAVKSSANDFTNLFQLVDALQLPMPDPYTKAVEGLVNVEEWTRVLAVERLVGNWDSFSYNRGKNMYAYKPNNGRWAMLAWDIDFVFNLGDGATSDVFAGGQDWPTYLMRTHPPFARAYWRAFYDAAYGPLLAARSTPLLDAKYAALQANGIAATAPTAIKSYIAQRRTYLLSRLATVSAPFSILTSTTTDNRLTVSGTAPVNIRTIRFTDVEYPVTWTSLTGWTATLPLQQGTNAFKVTGLDSTGTPVPGASNYLAVVYSPTPTPPEGQIVINELMVHPKVPGAEFIELYNASKTTSFDLSSWQLNGLAYTFPPGTVLGPASYLVLAGDRKAFIEAYGASAPLFDTFTGALQEDGETLALLRPGNPWTVVAKIRYEGSAPFPAVPGESMQLADPRQDNWRAGNWSDPGGPQWKYFSTTGTASSSTLYVYLQSAGDVYLDDLRFVSGLDPTQGANLLANGDFESSFPGPWTVSANHAGSALSTVVKHSGNSSLHLVATSAGSTQASSVWQTITPALTPNQSYSLSFWYLPSQSTTTLTVRLSGSGVSGSVALTPSPAQASADPGFVNVSSQQLPAFPPLWINELQAENQSGITNAAGQRAPWLELYNPATTNVAIAGLCLSTNYSNLTQWSFPAGTSIKPGEFKVVFADGRTNLSSPTELHTSFVLTPGTGSLALSRVYNGQPQVLDYVNYRNLTPNRSYGSLPDGQSFDRKEFYFSTPGMTNNGSLAPIVVFINEWMADNASTLPDPADGDYEDWFELYNASATPTDLGGYFLTDSPTNKFLFEIPDNGQYIIPPKGFLLVWADGETKQNTTNNSDLHVSFKLDRTGESIGLFGRTGESVDFVTFGGQITDASQGRFPDGSATIAVLNRPTPRSSNTGLNNPPTLTKPQDLWLYKGQATSFALQASDPDLPQQTLSYSLTGNPPPNASINAQNGIVSWAPTVSPGTHQLTAMVLDNGNPELSAAQSFMVYVFARPTVEIEPLQGTSLTLAVTTLPGQTYQWETCSELGVGIWVPAGPLVYGTGERILFSGEIASTGQMFYRLRILR